MARREVLLWVDGGRWVLLWRVLWADASVRVFLPANNLD
jgi:hypothetical protein